MIISGASLRDVAGQFGISKSSVDRHRPHISAKVAKAADVRERLSAEKLLDVMENLMGEAIATLRDAKASGDNRARLQAIREARETARVLLEVAGELDNGGQTITIINNPQWTAIRTVILQTLEPYPEAKAKLVAALTEVSG
jgi:hypothetical protein